MGYLSWPAAFVLVVVIFFVVVLTTTPSHRRHQIKMAEMKARGAEESKALNERYDALAQETREAQASLQADISAIRASVDAIEQMMRDVG